jgi:molybdopterin-dependent oxidoreductase-like protein protein
VVVIGWVAATPFTLRQPRVVQRVGFALIGPAQRRFEHLDATPGQYSEKDISPYFWHNGQYPDSLEYTALFDGQFAGYRLRIDGLVEHPVELSMTELRVLPHHEQITQHFCIQGWSGSRQAIGNPVSRSLSTMTAEARGTPRSMLPGKLEIHLTPAARKFPSTAAGRAMIRSRGDPGNRMNDDCGLTMAPLPCRT